MHTVLRFSILVSIAIATGPARASDQASFTRLGTLTNCETPDLNYEWSRAYGISADGRVVVGTNACIFHGNGSLRLEAFRWTQEAGMVGIGDLPGGAFRSEARATSADGSVVVGYGDRNLGDLDVEAFRWTEPEGMVGLGALNDYGESRAFGVSGDGRTVVGRSHLSGFRWTETEGMTQPPPYSHLNGASADGSIIVGIGGGPPPHAFRSTARTTQFGTIVFDPTDLGTIDQAGSSGANSVTPDGSVVVGWSRDNTASIQQAMRWTSATGMVGLGDLPGGLEWSEATGVSADGFVVVGWGNTPDGEEAFIWDTHNGMRNLSDLLVAYGADPGGTLTRATGISADGRMIVGSGWNHDPNGAWLAVVPDPTMPACSNGIDDDGDGLIDMADPGCPFPEGSPENPQCNDGIDNDGNGLIDFADPKCQRDWPYWEKLPPGCGLGAELVIPLFAMGFLVRRRRGA